jgi:hypothetical protein
LSDDADDKIVPTLELTMSFRLPGPLSRESLIPETDCDRRRQYSLLTEIDWGTLSRQCSPIPEPLGLSLWPEFHDRYMFPAADPGFVPSAPGMDEAITETDREEFGIVQDMGVYNHNGSSYPSVNSYVADRTLYFGSPNAYASFAAESDAELETTVWAGKKTRTLRSLLEFGADLKKQRIFYRWVRKALKRMYGDDANVPERIRKGMSEELARKIEEVRGSARVRGAQAENFTTGGFNPRPTKLNGRYRLGTLSKHALGMAVDIDPERNPQLTIEQWTFIESFVSKSVVRSGRWDTEAAAEGLWKDLKETSDRFKRKVADETRRIEAERARNAKTDRRTGGKPKPALEQLLGKHRKSLSRYAVDGFLHLPLELVLELRFHKFTWGATFRGNVDLHHFELD